ncbi:MAG: hypothetical protein MUF39_00395 [Cyclobacteriaceae bacterium]|nr:hypothetical protein [Cyclobacteriaceae bacterium]
MKFIFLFFSVLIISFSVHAQKQLVLMKGERVVARFTEGEYLKCKLKNKQKKEGRIIELTDTHVYTSNDSLTILSIESLYMKGKRKINATQGVGGLLFIAGIGYFAIDQLNTLIVPGQSGVDEQVAITSLVLTAAGAAMIFIHSPYKKVYGHTLQTIDYNSRYYQFNK